MSSDIKTHKIAHNLDIERTQDVKIDVEITFDGLLLSSKTLEGLTKCGFSKPSPIQLKAIPLGKCGFDLIVEAKSGTGKTAVFSVIALESVQLDIGCQCIIVAPTREIAVQIGQVITSLGCAFEGLQVEVVMGGTNFSEDATRLKNAKFQILVGTPGRLKHLIKEKIISTETVRLFVLDEADRLMENSFLKDINVIFSSLPERKQVVVASATYTPELHTFLANYMKSASHINPYNSRILLGVNQYVSIVKSHLNKVRQNQIILDEVNKILSSVPFKQCLVFCNYQATTRNTWKFLCDNGWPADFLSSAQTQDERLKSLHRLQSYQCRVLVATDLASRGLDAANVDLVINLETPYDLATYLHRVGRCGRYGSKGNSVTILKEQEETKFKELLKKFCDSFDVQPVSCLFANGLNEETSEDVPVNIEIKSNDTIDFAPLFMNDTKAVDAIINAFDTKSVDKLMDINSDFSVEDFYSSFLTLNTEHIVHESNYVDYLKNNVPDFDRMNECIKNIVMVDEDFMDDNTKNVESVNNVDTTSTEELCNRMNFTQSKKSKPKRIKNKNNSGNFVETPLPSNSNGQLESTSRLEEEVSDDSEENLVEFDDVEYWNWRQQLSAMSAFIEQTVYLETLSQFHNMDINDP